MEAHGRLDLLLVVEVGQVDDADDDLLVGQADADALAEPLVGAIERAQGLDEAVDVGDLAVADDARLERQDGGVLDAQTAVDRDRGGDDAGGVDVEPDEGLGALGHGEGRRRLGCRGAPSHRHQAPGPERGVGERPNASTGARPAAAASERVEVGVDELVADEQPTTPPSARNGPNGTAVLRPSTTPFRTMIAAPTTTPTMRRNEDRRCDGAAQVEPEDAGQLDVAHPHPARIQDRGDEEEAAAGDAGHDRLDEEVGVERGDDDDRRDGGGPVMRLGMIRWSRSIRAHRYERGDEQQPEDEAGGVVLRRHDDDVERRRWSARRGDSARRPARRSGGSARAGAATKPPGRCRLRAAGCRSSGSASAGARATRRAAAGRRRR